LGRRKEELGDFIDLYMNSYLEKEKFWQLLGCSGPLMEEANDQLLERAIKLTLDSRAIFSIHCITDWLSLGGILKKDAYNYRINVPGTVSPRNWSLKLPIPLEELLTHPVNKRIFALNLKAERII
jgi:4-alpha-glucanotransferase